MSNNYSSIFLNGFRASGKSTIGRQLARKLKWEYIEMDDSIVRLTRMSINTLTQQGRSWQKFREIEYQLLQELTQKTHVVVSTGGGVGVNTTMKNNTTTTYGKLNTQLMKKNKGLLLIVLTADEKVLARRLKADEMLREESVRPILNEKKSQEINEEIKRQSLDPIKQKQLLVDTMIQTELELYHIRKPLYESLSPYRFDTGKFSTRELVNQILSIL